MNGYGFAVVVALVVGGLTLASAGGVAAGGVTMGDAQTAPTADNASTMGDRLGAFMHSSSAAADGSIDRGMFEESLNESADAEGAIRERIDELEAEYETVRNQSATIDSNSTLPDPARRARMVRLTIQLDSLNTSINETERHAKAVGVDTERLDQLRANASELSGSEVAEIARSLAGVDPPGLSDDRPGNDTPDGENSGDAGDNGTGGGPPDGAGDGSPGDDGADEETNDA